MSNEYKPISARADSSLRSLAGPYFRNEIYDDSNRRPKEGPNNISLLLEFAWQSLGITEPFSNIPSGIVNQSVDNVSAAINKGGSGNNPKMNRLRGFLSVIPCERNEALTQFVFDVLEDHAGIVELRERAHNNLSKANEPQLKAKKFINNFQGGGELEKAIKSQKLPYEIINLIQFGEIFPIAISSIWELALVLLKNDGHTQDGKSPSFFKIEDIKAFRNWARSILISMTNTADLETTFVVGQAPLFSASTDKLLLN